MKPYIENNHNKDTELNHIEEFRTDRSGDNVERDDSFSHQISDINNIDSSAEKHASESRIDYTSPARTLFIERISTAQGEGSKEIKESIEVSVPQKDFGEEAVVVWDAGLVLAYYLVKHQSIYRFSDKQNPSHVIDVGAGTGVVGLVAAGLGANATLTDLPRILPLLEEGISANRKVFEDRQSDEENHFIRALPLKWGNLTDVHEVCRKIAANGKKVGGPPNLIVVSCLF